MTEETKSITTDYVVDETAVNLAKKKKRRLWTLLGVSTFLLAGGVVAYIMYQSGLAYKNAIPEDAPIVLEIDVRSIFAKSVMESYETKIADLIESVDPENVDLKNITESLTKKENTGISFFYPLYAFTDSSVENVFILASVSDKTDLINTIKSLDVDVHIYDSSKVSGGRMDDMRLAIMLFPAPGGPIISILCPPAAATSIARRTFSCPRTSEKSRSAENACI